MAANNYDTALRHVLKDEGGYVNHPSDPGGETNYGITIAVARENGYTGSMRSIPMDVVQSIYRKRYWDVLRCDALPSGLDYAVFDFGVNSGTGRSAEYLQRIVGVPDDGRIGPVTLAAVGMHDPQKLIQKLCDKRLAFLKGLRTWPVFGKGWDRRVTGVRAYALELAQKAPEPVPTSVPVTGTPPQEAPWSLKTLKDWVVK